MKIKAKDIQIRDIIDDRQVAEVDHRANGVVMIRFVFRQSFHAYDAESELEISREIVREIEVTVENIMKEFAPGEIPVTMLWAMPDDLSIEMLKLGERTIGSFRRRGAETFGAVRELLGSPKRGY